MTLDKSKTASSKPDVAESWQWDGSHDHTTWPEWLFGCSVHTFGDHLRLTAPQGNISVAKDEWIVKDSEGNIYVTKDDPSDVHPSSGAGRSSPPARGSAA